MHYLLSANRRNKQQFWAISICLGFLIILSSATNLFAFVQLTVTDSTGRKRIKETVTSGIPLPEELQIHSAEELVLTDASGKIVKAQFKTLSRWYGTIEETNKAIKWVLIDFQTDVSPNQTKTFYLRRRNQGESVLPSENILIEETAENILVNTGAARYSISKDRFNIFDHVWIDDDGDGQLDDTVLYQQGQGGIVLKDRNGKEFRAIFEKPEEIFIEEKGPLKATVRIRGVLKSADGHYFAPAVHHSGVYPDFDQPYTHSFVYYDCRLQFFINRDYVKVLFTLENNGANGRTHPEQYFAPIQATYFDSLYIVLKPDNDSTVNIKSDEAVDVSLSSSDTFILYQDWRENLSDDIKDTLEPNFHNGIFYTTLKNDEIISNGKTNPGWLDVNDGAKGIGLAVRNFWQNFPKKEVVTQDEIRIGLWPEEGYYPYCLSEDFPDEKFDKYCRQGGKNGAVYLFDAGRHKTYEIAMRFYSGNPDGGTERIANSVEHPLMAIAPAEWYAASGALGMIAPAGLTSPDTEINEAMARYDQLQAATVDPDSSENGLTAINLKKLDPPHNEFSRQNRYFGWMNFGDLAWSNQQPSALHYDWPYSMLLHYIRTGNRKFFDAGAVMAKHRYDIDQYHGDRTDDHGNHKYKNHMAFYESSGHSDPSLNHYSPSKVSLNSHTWNGGLVLYYLLTGDKKSLDAAIENGQAALNYFGQGGLVDASEQAPASHETRQETWPVLNLIHLYRATGKIEYLNVAKKILKNRLIVREQMAGGNGYFGAGENGDITDERQSSVMLAYAIEPVTRLYHETKDSEIGYLIVRMADFAKDSFLFGGNQNNEGKYMPLQGNYIWYKDDPDGTIRGDAGEPIKTVFFADLFASAYQITGQDVYMVWARKCFRDSTFYYSSNGSRFLDPKYRSIISYLDSMFISSRTKSRGWIGRTNQIYLYTEWQNQKNDSANRVLLPLIFPNSGNYVTPVTVAIDCFTPDVVIRYTLDGTAPVNTSPIYSTPLEITETTTIRAKSFTPSGETSAVSAVEFVIGETQAPSKPANFRIDDVE